MISVKSVVLALGLFVCCNAAFIPQDLKSLNNFQDYEISPEEKASHPDVGLRVVSTTHTYFIYIITKYNYMYIYACI